MLTALVAVENTAYHFDKLYTYLVPSKMADRLECGCRVSVPFGAGNRKRQGMVFELINTSEDMPRIKLIYEQLDSQPLLSGELLELARWISQRYFCTLFESARLLIPTGINLRMVAAYQIAENVREQLDEGALEFSFFDELERDVFDALYNSGATVELDRLAEIFGEQVHSVLDRLCSEGLVRRNDEAVRRMGDATVKMVRLVSSEEDEEEIKLTPKQSAVVSLLETAGSASVKEICYFTGVTAGVVATLEKRGVVETFMSEVYRNPYEIVGKVQEEDIVLSPKQQNAYDALLEQYREGAQSTALLYGVTGSGKTSVFMKLIDRVVEDGRGVIVMVPEIALTPQTLDKFHRRYGRGVAVFHSGLSIGQRMDEWKRVKRGDAHIAIGTRSAVFAPFENLGLIIMDEEQEYTYKSEMTPRFHARDVARFRASYNHGLLVLASATPSIETYYNALCSRYSLQTLDSRYGDAVLPQVELVDISSRKGDGAIISPQLEEYLRSNLENGYQSILLLNRRGYNTFVACRACGHVLMCDNCSVSLTYHHDNGRLMCHYCGNSMLFTNQCPSCGEHQLRYAGLGTQRVMEEIARLFPEARVLRMDADSTMTRDAHEKKLGSFGRGEYDIMVGTQMVAKGLDFEKVTLVGVLLADMELYADDFRSYERTFSLLTQVVGRSGRGRHSGRAVIQTLDTNNEIFDMAAQQDYVRFYESEIKVRKAMLYPPFAEICLVGFISEDEQKTEKAANCFLEYIKNAIATDYSDVPIRTLGPSSAMIGRINRKYRYKLIIKCKGDARFRQMMRSLLVQFGNNRAFSSVGIFVDVNPDSVM